MNAVAHLEGLIYKDGDAAEHVGHKVLGGHGQRQAADAHTGDERTHIVARIVQGHDEAENPDARPQSFAKDGPELVHHRALFLEGEGDEEVENERIDQARNAPSEVERVGHLHGGVDKSVDLFAKGKLTISRAQRNDGQGQHQRFLQLVDDEVVQVRPGLGGDFSGDAADDLIKNTGNDDAANAPGEGDQPVRDGIAQKGVLEDFHGDVNAPAKCAFPAKRRFSRIRGSIPP